MCYTLFGQGSNGRRWRKSFSTHFSFQLSFQSSIPTFCSVCITIWQCNHKGFQLLNLLDSTQFDSTRLCYTLGIHFTRAHTHLSVSRFGTRSRASHLLGGNLVTISISVLNSFHSVVCLNMVIHFFRGDNIIGIWIRLFNADTLLTEEKRRNVDYMNINNSERTMESESEIQNGSYPLQNVPIIQPWTGASISFSNSLNFLIW